MGLYILGWRRLGQGCAHRISCLWWRGRAGRYPGRYRESQPSTSAQGRSPAMRRCASADRWIHTEEEPRPEGELPSRLTAVVARVTAVSAGEDDERDSRKYLFLESDPAVLPEETAARKAEAVLIPATVAVRATVRTLQGAAAAEVVGPGSAAMVRYSSEPKTNYSILASLADGDRVDFELGLPQFWGAGREDSRAAGCCCALYAEESCRP